MSEIAELAAAVLAFLDADAAYGSAHPRTNAARSRLRRVARRVLAEGNVVDLTDAAADRTAA